MSSCLHHVARKRLILLLVPLIAVAIASVGAGPAHASRPAAASGGAAATDADTAAASTSPADDVDPLIGTAGGHGTTTYGGMIPSTTAPFGMTQWSPMTRVNRVSVRPYAYEDQSIMGFIGTHQPAIWMGDFGYLSVMPGVDAVVPDMAARALPFSHADEVSHPYYYGVSLDAGQNRSIRAELTSTAHAGFMRFTYPAGTVPTFVSDATRAGITGYVHVDPARSEITGWNPDRMDSNLGPLQLPNFKGYFAIEIDHRFADYGTYQGSTLSPGTRDVTAAQVGGYATFPKTQRAEVIQVRIGTSFISIADARRNLNQEIPSWDFNDTVNELKTTWNHTLSRIEITATPQQRRIFYTSMFHALQYPSDITENGQYYSAFDDTVHRGTQYTSYSIWDTFRAENSLLTLVAPERIDGMVQALLNDYQQGGWLPMWPNPSYTNIMIGTHADSLIAEAMTKGFHGFDWNLAYQAVRKDATTPPDRDTELKYSDRQQHTPFEARAGLTYELQGLGYVPLDKTAEAGSRTLDYAYDDAAVARVAQLVGADSDAATFLARSKNYRNLYNTQTGFMQTRNSDGSWANGGWTEGDQWAYTYDVMQDVPGLIDLLGKQHFIDLLDQTFAGGHENHTNEPMHHYPYLYDYVGQPWKTQRMVREVAADNYFDSPAGLMGQEDAGQMSAWYILSALGFYSVDPSSGQYAIGSPMFDRATIHLAGHRSFTVVAHGQAPAAYYIQSATLNGKAVNQPFLSWSDIVNGGTLDLQMALQPSAWAADSAPPPPPVDVAQDKPAEMLGATPFPNHGPQQAVDGSTTTYAQSHDNSLWDLRVDIGAPTAVDRIVFTPDGSNYATQYAFKVSTDGVTWTTVATETAGDGQPRTYEFPSTQARYVLLDVSAVHGGGANFGHAVRALEVDRAAA